MSTATRDSLIEAYKKKIESYDEILLDRGGVKPIWEQLLQNLDSLGLEEIQHRHQEIIRELRQNGVTYNVYDAKDSMSRPWQIDPVPFLIEQQDWREIEKGVQQRSQLLNILLQDIYGSRHLLRDKIIPPELLYRHSGFLRACHNLQLPQQRWLTLHGLDMARGPKGNMWVLSDRAAAPSGMGYALENRKVMNQLMPELSQGIITQPLDPFFISFQKSILSLLPYPKENPFIVYLTPGPMNETYFEHSYLASYMGYTLVQGSDLIVRDGFVWLKCIDGLQKVDVIIRRIDDSYCDPLELNPNSMLGIAGLLEVMRKGNVAVVNPPGSGILENRGLFAFMKSICKYYLNEELLLPNMATWWCGQEKERKYVLENLDKLIIKKIDRNERFSRIYGSTLSQEKLHELKQQIQQHPYDFIGHEDIGFPSVPSFVNEDVQPRMAAIRCYSIASQQGGYQVMPGGLTRTSADEGSFSVSNRYGGISKDTWIVGNMDSGGNTELRNESMRVNPQQTSLSSRGAENLFWVGRMTERSIATTSFLNLVLDAWIEYRRSDLPIEESPLKLLLIALTNLTITYPGFVGKGSEKLLKKPSAEILDLATNPDRTGSVPFDLQALGNAGISIREHISLESWKVLDLVKESKEELQKARGKRNPIIQIQQQLQNANRRLFTFYGTLAETMPRHHGRLLFKAGKLIERSLASISVIRTLLGFQQPAYIERALMEKALVYHHSLTHYRLNYRNDMQVRLVLDTLLYASHLPYSLTSALEKLNSYLKILPQKTDQGRLNASRKLLLSATALLQLKDTETLAAPTETGYREDLDDTLSQIADHLLNLSSALTDMYFNHTQTQYL